MQHSFTNIQRKGETGYDGGEAEVLTVSTTQTTYHHHYPPTPTEHKVGEEEVFIG